MFGAMRHLYHVRMTREILLHLTYEDMAVYSLYDVRKQKKHGFTISIMIFELIHLGAYSICSVLGYQTTFCCLTIILTIFIGFYRNHYK